MKPPRAVYIDLLVDRWFVRYVQRTRGQRNSAASFYAPTHSREFVEKWVRQNPKLVLRIDV